MDNTTAEFRKHSAEFEDEVKRYAEADDASDIVYQLGTCKALLSEIVRNATTAQQRQQIAPIARDLLRTCASLSESHVENQRRKGMLIPRDQLDHIVGKLCDIVCQELQRGGVPNFEAIIDSVLNRLDEIFPQSEPAKVKKHAK